MAKFRINGRDYEAEPRQDETLLSLLRESLGLTGTKYGCGEGACGACTVLVDGAARRSCRMKASDAAGKEILTIEGLASGSDLHPVQAAFLKHNAFQCGYCTSGMIMAIVGLLKAKPSPSETEIIDALDRNICRCCTYPRILEAVKDASNMMKEAGR